MLDPERQREAAVRADHLRSEAEWLRSQAAALDAQAKTIEKTWGLEGSDGSPEA